MTLEAIASAKIKTLAPQHQQEVLDFIDLKTKEQRQASEATQSVAGDASKQIEPVLRSLIRLANLLVV